MTNELHLSGSQAETNPLYIRMRSRFDFSGNRTIGEFMMMKAIREGYDAPSASHQKRRGKSVHWSCRSLASAVALLLSCVLLIFCTVNFIDSVMNDELSSSVTSSGQQEAVRINTLTDESVVKIVFPSETSDISSR